MLIIRATKNLRERIGQPTMRDGDRSTTLLGDWYATALPWRPQVALLVNERTLLPVLGALAPAATMLARAADQIALTLAAYGAHPAVIQAETDHMHDCRIAPTANSAPGVGSHTAAACPSTLVCAQPPAIASCTRIAK